MRWRSRLARQLSWCILPRRFCSWLQPCTSSIWPQISDWRAANQAHMKEVPRLTRAGLARQYASLWHEGWTGQARYSSLAARIRINRNYIGMIERQENSPTVTMLERMAKALGIEPARLFDEKVAGRKGE